MRLSALERRLVWCAPLGRPRLKPMTRKKTKHSRKATQRTRKSLETWHSIVTDALVRHRGTASLADLYRAIERHPRTATAKFWRAKIRQVLEASDEFVRVDFGVWSLSANHSKAMLRKFNALRHERYPKRAAIDR